MAGAVIDQVLPDHGTSEAMRHQFIGNEKGLRHLQNLLNEREAELREKIKEQEQNNNSDKETT